MTRQTLQHSLRKTFWDVRAQYLGFTTFCDAHNEARCTERNAIREPSRTWCWEGFHKCRQTSDKRRLPAHTQITSGLVWFWDMTSTWAPTPTPKSQSLVAGN